MSLQLQRASTQKPSMPPLPQPKRERRCACGKKIEAGGECAECRKRRQQSSPAVQRHAHDFRRINVSRRLSLPLSQPHDASEREAAQLAEKTVVGQKANAPRQNPSHSSSDGFGLTTNHFPRPISNVLTSGGRPLELTMRRRMEKSLGHDFARVRIHQGAAAERTAEALGARAYTAGDDIVFGRGEFNPRAPEGERLLAHELIHTLQQRGGPPMLQRACLPASECTAPRSTLTEFVQETEKKPANISKADKRKKACTKTPPDAACTSDGHGAKATACTKIMETYYKSRLSYITGVFVDKDMPADYGAVTFACSGFMPPLPGGTCTFVPDQMEAEAKQFFTGNHSISGWNRNDWLRNTLEVLTHETEHARFDAAPALAKPSATSTCKFEDHEGNLSELAADLSEMHVAYRAALARPSQGRFDDFHQMFNRWVKGGGEDISGMVKDIRCKCECSDADHFIKKTAESVSTSQKWDSNELTMIHSELRDPKWGFKPPWPINPPSAVDVYDLPTVTPAALKFE